MKNDASQYDVALLLGKIEELESTVHTLRQSPGIVLFDYQDGSRRHYYPGSYLSDCGGYLHVDGYEAYEKTDAKRVGCWAHARRKFTEAEQSQPKGKQGKDGRIQWAIKTMVGFDFKLATGVPRKSVKELESVSFVESLENVFLLGPSGVGKTHLASVLGYLATKKRIKTKFITTSDLMMQLGLANRQGKLKPFMQRSILAPKLLIIDEIGYLHFGREEANLFFNIVAKRYEKGSIILTGNLTFSQWPSTFADDATLTAATLVRSIAPSLAYTPAQWRQF